MDKLALMLVGVFILAGLHVTINSQSNVSEAETRLAKDSYEILARNAALAGISRAEQMLPDDFHSYEDVTGTNDGVPYTFDAEVTGNDVVVHSVGTAEMSNGTSVEYNVKVQYKRRMVIPPEAPENMRYAIISDQDLVLSGGISGEVYADGEEGNELNANFHTNANLQAVGTSSHIKGFGTYMMTADPSAEQLSDIFVPNNNPNGTDHVYDLDNTVTIDFLNTMSLASTVVPDSTTSGSAELTGTWNTGGTRDDPYIWHVEGDLLIKGNATVNGYAMFIVDGGVDIRGNAKVGDVGYDGGDESSLALYAGAGVRTRGNVDVWAQIYSNGGIEFGTGTPTVYGSVTTRGTVDFRGNVQIYYRKASPALTRPFQPDLDVLDRLTYSEW